MTDTIITDGNNTVIVTDSSAQTIVRDVPSTQIVVTGIMGPPGASTFADLKDIDLTGIGPGSILVYNTISEKWTATNLLEQQILEAGQY